MHVARTNLHLDRLATRTDDRRVQGLIQVELGHCDVVLESPHYRLPMTVDRAKRCVAVLDRIDDDTNGHQIEDFIEVATLADHLFVQAPQMLAASGQLRLDRQIIQPGADLSECLRQVDVTLRGTRRHEIIDFCVPLRIERRERQILELLFHLLHTESVRKWRIDVERLLGGSSLLFHAGRCDRAHVVQTISEFDDQHAHVARHRNQHLAHGRRLLSLSGIELQPLKLGETIDDA